jgi:periplasmic copper chaperone A
MRVMMVATAASMLALAGCDKKPEPLSVSDGWVRLPAVKGQPGAAYFTVHGGPVADRLALVTANLAIRSEMHESMKAGGMMTMKPLDTGVAIPAGTKVEFKPGGLHVMLFDIRPDLAPPGPMSLSLRFASGTTLTINAEVKSAGGK